MYDKFIEEVSREIGSENIYLDRRRLYPYSRDYWPYQLYNEVSGYKMMLPYAVIAPATEEDIVKVLELAGRYRVKIIPYSGGSGVLGGINLSGDEIVLDLGKLNWIRWYDEKSGIVEVGAGVLMIELEKWLNKHGYTSRHYPQSMPNAMIGGLIATKSTGQYSTGYGGIENLLLGMHVAVPSLGLLKISPLPRRSVLISLDKLFIGGEGLYGVITDAYLQVFKEPRYRRGFGFKTDSFKSSIDKSYKLIKSRVYPDLYRVFDEYETIINYPDIGWGSLSIGCIEGDDEKIVEDKLNYTSRIYEEDSNEEYFWRWFKERNDVIKWIYKLYENGLGFDTIEVSTRWSNLLEIYNTVRRRVLEIDGVETVTGHVGHFYNTGAGLYFTFTYRLDKFKGIYFRLWDKVLRTTNELGGGISHHHGIGEIRMKYVHLEYDEIGIMILKQIKKILDPENIMRELKL